MAKQRRVSEILEEHLSLARLRPYRAAVGGDLDQAVALYAWNAHIAGAFFEDLGHLEVLLRNALHNELETWHGRLGRHGQWYDDPASILDQRTSGDITAARQRLARSRQPESPGRVVAELSFGFWRFLLDQRYQAPLWAPALRHAFPHLQPQTRRTVYDPLVALHKLRNRIAHHEPIHHLPLTNHRNELLLIVGYIDPAMATWLTTNSRVHQTMLTRP